MTATAHLPIRTWTRAHRVVLVLVLLAVALAAAAVVLLTRGTTGGSAAVLEPEHVSSVPLSPVDDGCATPRPGLPC